MVTAYEPTYKTYPQTITNPLNQSESRTYDPKWGRPLSITDIDGVAYGYDPNGNMVTRGAQEIKYNPENRPVRVKSGGATISRFTYDGDGVRRKRLDSNGTIHYVGPCERNVGNGANTVEVVTKYYYASLGALRRLVAFRRAGVLYYVGTDYLGSTIRVPMRASTRWTRCGTRRSARAGTTGPTCKPTTSSRRRSRT